VVERPFIHLRVVVQRNVFLPAMLVAIYGFGSTATAFVLPDI
jgi:DHA2 family multidrug resistance protein